MKAYSFFSSQAQESYDVISTVYSACTYMHWKPFFLLGIMKLSMGTCDGGRMRNV